MTRPAAPGGPYQTERQAAAAAGRSCAAAPGVSPAAGNRRLLEQACTAAQVTPGDWDHRILAWLAGWEPAACAVIAGLITRAATARPRCSRPVPARQGKKAP